MTTTEQADLARAAAALAERLEPLLPPWAMRASTEGGGFVACWTVPTATYTVEVDGDGFQVGVMAPGEGASESVWDLTDEAAQLALVDELRRVGAFDVRDHPAAAAAGMLDGVLRRLEDGLRDRGVTLDERGSFAEAAVDAALREIDGLRQTVEPTFDVALETSPLTAEEERRARAAAAVVPGLLDSFGGTEQGLDRFRLLAPAVSEMVAGYIRDGAPPAAAPAAPATPPGGWYALPAEVEATKAAVLQLIETAEVSVSHVLDHNHAAALAPTFKHLRARVATSIEAELGPVRLGRRGEPVSNG